MEYELIAIQMYSGEHHTSFVKLSSTKNKSTSRWYAYDGVQRGMVAFDPEDGIVSNQAAVVVLVRTS
jgi:hypothetical protein